MRTLMIATALAAMGIAGAAEAGTRVVRNGPGMTRASMPRPVIHAPRPGMGWNKGHFPSRPRWGGHVQGRWWGGYRAPGGWGAYRRPIRGWVLPGYWIAPSWYVTDWSGYGLPQPPQGYNWSRYYDDAVLIDGRGSVYDTIGGVDWEQHDSQGADYSYREGDAQGGYVQPGAGYAYPERRDSGLGGAAVGAVAGGVAGNLIAGRGNRLGGTLIGAGVGAAAGYAIDKAEDRGRRGPPGAGYAQPSLVQHQGGGTTVVTNGGYYANGFYYPGATVTTITVAAQPVVTTTTTEIFDDRVTYSRAPVKKVWAKKTWRAAPKCVCR